MVQRTFHIIGVLFFLGKLLFSVSHSSVPSLVNFQGLLTDSTGTIMPDGNYSVTFRIYGDSVTPGSIWQEGQLVTVMDGLFNVTLGAITPFPDTLFKETYRWVGVQIGLDSEIIPRTQLTSVPYSLHSKKSDSSEFAELSALALSATTADSANVSDTSIFSLSSGNSDSLGGISANSFLGVIAPRFYYSVPVLDSSTFTVQGNQWHSYMSVNVTAESAGILKITATSRAKHVGGAPSEFAFSFVQDSNSIYTIDDLLNEPWLIPLTIQYAVPVSAGDYIVYLSIRPIGPSGTRTVDFWDAFMSVTFYPEP